MSRKRIPEVGDFWRHDSFREVYKRIGDEAGKEVLGDFPKVFYSVNELGEVRTTNRNEGDFVILKNAFRIRS